MEVISGGDGFEPQGTSRGPGFNAQLAQRRSRDGELVEENAGCIPALASRRSRAWLLVPPPPGLRGPLKECDRLSQLANPSQRPRTPVAPLERGLPRAPVLCGGVASTIPRRAVSLWPGPAVAKGHRQGPGICPCCLGRAKTYSASACCRTPEAPGAGPGTLLFRHTASGATPTAPPSLRITSWPPMLTPSATTRCAEPCGSGRPLP